MIHPDECIDCNACVPVCPVEAIFADDEVPDKWEHYTEWNAYLAEQWKNLDYVITEKHGENAEHNFHCTFRAVILSVTTK